MVKTISSALGNAVDVSWSDQNKLIGLDRDSEVTLNIKNVSCKAALEKLSRALYGQGLETTWQVLEDGTIQFGTKATLNSNQEIVIYDIKDLLLKVPNFSNAPQIDLNQVLQQGGNGGSPFQNDPAPPSTRPDPNNRPEEELIRLIIQYVEPEQWMDAGGNGGSIRFFNGSLIIQAAPYIHRALR